MAYVPRKKIKDRIIFFSLPSQPQSLGARIKLEGIMRSQDPCKNLVLELVSFNTMIQFVLLVDLEKAGLT